MVVFSCCLAFQTQENEFRIFFQCGSWHWPGTLSCLQMIGIEGLMSASVPGPLEVSMINLPAAAESQ